MKLEELIENPDNPSVATDEEIARLAGKLERIPEGLRAMRIAYVTDAIPGKKMVISGNKRLRVLKRRYGDGKDLPDEWFQDVTDMTPEQRKEFIVDANVSDGSWDLDKLLAQYDKKDLEEFIGADALQGLIEEANKEFRDRKTGEDAVPETGEIPASRKGAVYRLGRHRLKCGDSTDCAQVLEFMGEERADLVVTDPPYNVNISNSSGLKIANDNMSDKDFLEFTTKAFKSLKAALKDGGVFYIWYGDGGVGYDPSIEFGLALRAAGLPVRGNLIWVKNQMTFSLGRLDFNKRHEPCYYGWKPGGKHVFYGGNSLTTVTEDDKPDFKSMTKDELRETLEKIFSDDFPCSVVHEKKPIRNAIHPTMKPVRLIERQLGWSSAPGDLVLDLFLGSGTTLIACEKTGRRCYGLEYDPKYCDAIRKRWAEFTHGEGCDWEALTPEEDGLAGL